MKQKFFILCLSIVLTAASFKPVNANPSGAGVSPAQMINAVNQLRATFGVGALRSNSLVMTSAQKHSEYQAFIGSWTHTGPGGTNETDRAVAVGYGGGKKVICDEAVAVATPETSADYIVNTLWADNIHRNVVLLNNRYEDIGVGAAEKGGLVYYTVDECVITGETGNTPRPTQERGTETWNTLPAVTYSTLQMPTVITLTPQLDGSIIHIVQPNETVWSIAIAYNLKAIDICTLNGISCDNPIIYVNQKLILRKAYTPTSTPTITDTPKPPTRTLRPTRTASPTRSTRTFAPSETITNTPVKSPVSQRSVGITIIIISALGILAVVAIGVIGKRPEVPPSPLQRESEPDPENVDLSQEDQDDNANSDNSPDHPQEG
jgi:uncharacterized protein YkwD